MAKQFDKLNQPVEQEVSMKFRAGEMALAGDLIQDTLTFLIGKGIIDVDLLLVDFSTSAFRALEREYLDGPAEEDKTDEGLMAKGVRFALCAVYFDGTPVISKDVGIVEVEDGD